jgi:hypothetical protein|tara:strand:+ start:596 stop:817 length:222 start_codon:yes stop_codon:yes gene_type:complete
MFKKNRIALRVLMAQHDLSAGEVGDVIGRNKQTVAVYCSRELSDIPDELLLLLEEHCVKIDVGADGAEDYEDI